MEGTEPVEQQIGARIKERRVSLGLSQGVVAERMRNLGYEGWQQTTISKVEQAERPLRLNEMADLARALGTSAIRLLEPEPFNLELAKATEDVRRAREQAVHMEWRVKELDAQLRRAVEDSGEAQRRLAEAIARMDEATKAYIDGSIDV